MGRILFGIIAAVASFMLVESLKCNKCNYGLAGFCLSNSEETCSTNTSQCFTGKAVFPAISSTVGFSTQGCRESSTCNSSSNGTLLSVTYELTIECCSTDNCNPVTLSGAPSAKMTLSAVASVALLATVLGSML